MKNFWYLFQAKILSINTYMLKKKYYFFLNKIAVEKGLI